ncbi:SnoaL-like domain-containing protein [Spirosoma taeanense]|uniref:SnoaL-like domain-containing protein n=1 Tax=Spirosoma taeanense TaxID=2735870 RepID=A0A6M5Y8E7_9BACT|nr:nuclear transport factor 2 family protein [Spirosoma taeanense]QJW90179.1 SnoaL-like domain-containing protein [Spirosoma taeanense]
MKRMTFLLSLLLLSGSKHCLCQPEKPLSAQEIAQIKNDIIRRAEKNAQDLRNRDYKAVMTFYADIDDFIIFGDGYYWGDYKTIDGIWKDFTGGVKKMLKWDFYNPKIHVFSRDVASCLVEFYNERIEANGDTTKGHGCFSFGMQKIDSNWKVVTMHVTHNYNVFDSTGAVRKWWLKYSPEARKK